MKPIFENPQNLFKIEILLKLDVFLIVSLDRRVAESFSGRVCFSKFRAYFPNYFMLILISEAPTM